MPGAGLGLTYNLYVHPQINIQSVRMQKRPRRSLSPASSASPALQRQPAPGAAPDPVAATPGGTAVAAGPTTVASAPRTNRERTDATRQALMAAARALFVRLGYAATSTPAIVAETGLTRGALYHHFVDKRDLFRAVVAEESHRVAQAIDEALTPTMSPTEALHAGSAAYLAAMRAPGRTRLLLIDAPAVLGGDEVAALDEAGAAGALREGLAAALGVGTDVPVAEIASLLSAAFDRAALAIDAGADADAFGRAMEHLLTRAVAPARERQRRS